MLSVENIVFVQRLIAAFIAYLITAGLVGGFQAWVCKRVGDDIPERNGYLTINPLAHADIFGVICVLLIGIGFNAPLPINPFNMPYRGRTIRYAIALFSSVFISIMLSVFWVVLMMALNFGEAPNQNGSFYSFFFVDSFFDALMLVLYMLFITGLFFAVVRLVYNSFSLLAYYIHDKISDDEKNLIAWIFLILPIAVLFFYGNFLSAFIMKIIMKLVGFFQGAI